MKLIALSIFILTCTSVFAQTNPVLEERFGFREWRLGSTFDLTKLEGATALQATDPCFQLHRLDSTTVGSLRHLPITGIELTYQAEALQNVGVEFAADHFTELLDACEQVFGESITVSGASSTGGDVMQWTGTDVYLELGLARKSSGAQVTRLSYEWTNPSRSYDQCVEDKRPKFNAGDF